MRALMVIVAATACDAFNLARPVTLRAGSLAPAPAPARAAALMQFGQKKKPLTLEERGYWPGEWVCADCGYIYAPGEEPPFEELRPRWKCPQCAGPRRRFVKKAGNMVGEVDDSGLINGTIGAALLIVALVYVGLTL